MHVLNGLDAEMQPLSDFLHAGRRDQHAQHIEFARREIFQRPVLAGKARKRQGLCDIRAEDLAAANNATPRQRLVKGASCVNLDAELGASELRRRARRPWQNQAIHAC